MPSLTLRRATQADIRPAAQICFDAFYTIGMAHGFKPHHETVEPMFGMFELLFKHPKFYCLIAEENGQIVGSNCMDERSSILGIGPITVSPKAQNRGTGKLLMKAVLERAAELNAPGVRLVQAAFHGRSLSLYASLGFDVREPLAVMQGPCTGEQIPGFPVRAATVFDLNACNQLATRMHGHHRSGELQDAIDNKTAVLVERNGRITGYATEIGFIGHATAESTPDLMAMIAAAKEIRGAGMLVPTRNAELFRWCLARGLRVIDPMTLMSLGLYSEPAGAFLPSILY